LPRLTQIFLVSAYGLLGLTGGGCLVGCAGGDRELYPIDEHSHWSYFARTVNTTTDHVSYAGRVAVGNSNGYELKSDLGVIHLAWTNGNLVTDQMASSRFLPPLPILTEVSKKPVAWQGWIDTGDRREAARAKIVTDHAKLSLHGLLVDTTRTTVALSLADRQISLINWYRSGVGLVRQEQRTDGRLDMTLEYLDQS
jgi:hypothetical protein